MSSSSSRSGDFTLYDHVLDTSIALNVIPSKYTGHNLSQLDVFFAMGRGRQRDGVDVESGAMLKWFDSNYHYIVPELSDSVQFKLNSTKHVDEYLEAKEIGIETRPVVVGPISYLVLGKASREAGASFKPISLLPKVLPVYVELLKKLAEAGAKEVQIDEPTLVLDSTSDLAKEFQETYKTLSEAVPSLKITIATYFSRLDSNINYVKDLPVHGIHIDLDRGSEQYDAVISALKPTNKVVSLGLVSGRNIWKNDFNHSIEVAKKAISQLGSPDRVVIATSSSLLHTPVTLANEKKLSSEVKDWFAFATEKTHEVATIAKVVSGSTDPNVQKALQDNADSIKRRRDFESQSDSAVRDRLAKVTPEMYNRKSKFPQRKQEQDKKHPLPKFPTTTIGSFPVSQPRVPSFL